MDHKLEDLVAQFTAILLESTLNITRIKAAETTVEKAVLCIISLKELYYISSQCYTILSAIMEFEEVKEALKSWHSDDNRTIYDISTRPDFLRAVILKLDREKFNIIAKNYIININPSSWDSQQLLPDLEVDAEDKIRCEEKWRDINNRYYSYHTDRGVCHLWLNAAKKFPSPNDSVIAGQMIAKELQLADIDPFLTELLQAFPNVDGEAVVRSVKKWPRPSGNSTAEFIRKELPDWLLKSILGTTVEDCNYHWIQKYFPRTKQTELSEILTAVDPTFQLFDVLPEDLFYYLMKHLYFEQVIALSLTNKHMLKLVNESQHIWGQLGNKYFTNILVNNAQEFRRKYTSKFVTGKLWHQCKPIRWSTQGLTGISDNVLSIELNGDKVITAHPTKVTWVETHCLEPRKNRKNKKIRSVWIKEAHTRSARLLNDHIFAVSSGWSADELSSITIVNLDKFSSSPPITCPMKLKYRDLYFTIDPKWLICKGFAMDLTSQKFINLDWNTNLAKWIIRDDIIYGMGDLDGGTNILKLYDQRSSEALIAEMPFDKLQCFNVRCNDIYTVTSHVTQWDKRYISRPVRSSTDPFFRTKTKNRVQGRPAIDLTSMTVIGPDQIWDLTDFTWQLAPLPREKSHITTNGILVAYMSDGIINLRQNAVTTDVTLPIVAHPELNCEMV